jgi:hypothetical protein
MKRWHLSANAPYWRKLWSIRFAVLTTFFSSGVLAYLTLDDSLKASIPHWFVRFMSMGDVLTGMLAGVSVMIKQQLSSPPPSPTVPPNATQPPNCH